MQNALTQVRPAPGRTRSRHRAVVLMLGSALLMAGAWLAGADPGSKLAPRETSRVASTAQAPGPGAVPGPAPVTATAPNVPPAVPAEGPAAGGTPPDPSPGTASRTASRAASTGTPTATPPEDGAPLTLFLTIVGDQVHRSWGPAGSRPPRVDGLPRGGDLTLAAAMDGSPPPAVTTVSFLGPGERPQGPAPQQCPRTLPPGSSQATADALRSQAGCRYLSSCDVLTQQCTWFYQGRS